MEKTSAIEAIKLIRRELNNQIDLLDKDNNRFNSSFKFGKYSGLIEALSIVEQKFTRLLEEERDYDDTRLTSGDASKSL